MATDIRVVRLDDLPDWHESGSSIRACCPVHNGDNPSALQVQISGEYAGFGYCHTRCQRTVVLVEDLNPVAAEHIRRKQTGVASNVDRSFSLLPPPDVGRIKEWQIQERQLLCSLTSYMQQALEWSSWAQQYLWERGVPMDVARLEGMGYLPRSILRDPAYASHVRLLRRWVNSLVFPLHERRPVTQEGEEPYTQGFIARTLRLWRPGMDEEVHRGLLDAYNAEVLEHNKQEKQRGTQHFKALHLRWAKTRPAGWIYRPAQVGGFMALVEGGFDKLGLLSAIDMAKAQGAARSFTPGNLIALAGTAARSSLLPPGVRSVLLALDGDAAGLERMLCLREEMLQEDRAVYLCPPPPDGCGKDWSARWRKTGVAGVLPFFHACDYVTTWLQHPSPSDACVILVEELADALALLSSDTTLGISPRQIVVLTSRDLHSAWFSPHVQAAIFAVREEKSRSEVGQVEKIQQQTRTRMLAARADLLRAGVRIYQCPPPNDGDGATWSERWHRRGTAGVRELLDAFAYVRTTPFLSD